MANFVRAVRKELASAVKARDLRSLRKIAQERTSGGKAHALDIRLGKTHAVRVEAARELLDVAAEAQEWEIACSAAETLADMYRKIYPKVSVATGVAEAKAAKLFWLLENGAAARRHAMRSLTHLEKLVPCSALIAEVQEVLHRAAVGEFSAQAGTQAEASTELRPQPPFDRGLKRVEASSAVRR